MKIIFMGSAVFAVPSLEAILKMGHETPLVVCQPDQPSGRGLKPTPCPVASFARAKGLKLLQPKTLRDETVQKQIRDVQADLIVIVAYGKILPKEILDTPNLGCINLHASLLPKYRGAAPINWAIVKGEKTTGVTTMYINERMDSGDILMQRETEIGPDETASLLHDRLSVMGALLLAETIEGIEKGTLTPRPQDENKAVYAPILKKTDGQIDWNKGAVEIFNLVRGMQPWPAAYTHIDGKMLKIFSARTSAEKKSDVPGTIVEADQNLAVATGDGTLYLLEVQIEGKKRMTCDAFLRGHKIKVGETFHL